MEVLKLHINHILILLALIFLLPIISCSCNDSESHTLGKDFSGVDSIIYLGIKDSIYPGAALVIGDDKEIIYQKVCGGYDYSDSTIKIETNTIFDLASVTKVLATTLAIMKLYEIGRIDLNATVTSYIPLFAQNGKENILIRNLLVHNSGFPAGRPFYKFCTSSEQVFDSLFSMTLSYQTATNYIYSDLNFITLGKIVEIVAGKTLDKFCAENFYRPMGLNSTMFNPPDSLWPQIAPTEIEFNYRLTGKPGMVRNKTTRLMNGVAGHAGLFSSLTDIAKISSMLLNKGLYKNKRYLKESTIELFTIRYSSTTTRGFGWDTGNGDDNYRVGNMFSSAAFGHTGYTGTSVWIDPKIKLFIVFLTNRTYGGHIDQRIYKFRPLVHDKIIQAIKDIIQ